MRVYTRSFEGNLLEVDSILMWIESYISHAQNLEIIGLAFCECVHNIIEHHIMRVDKKQFFLESSRKRYSTHNRNKYVKIPYKARHLRFKHKTIDCIFVIKPTRIHITLIFPFKPCYKMLQEFKTLGGRGKQIIKFCSAKVRIKAHYGLSRGVAMLHIPIVNKIKCV